MCEVEQIPPEHPWTCLSQAVHTHRENKDVASYVKREFDKRYLQFDAEGAFHCVAGRHFASGSLPDSSSCLPASTALQKPYQLQSADLVGCQRKAQLIAAATVSENRLPCNHAAALKCAPLPPSI